VTFTTARALPSSAVIRKVWKHLHPSLNIHCYHYYPTLVHAVVFWCDRVAHRCKYLLSILQSLLCITEYGLHPVCLSVRLTALCLFLFRQRKTLKSPKITKNGMHMCYE